MPRTLLLIFALLHWGVGCTMAGPASSLKTNEAAVQQPVRTVKEQTLSSTAVPSLNIKFDKAFKYLGTQKFVLYDVANAEQHFFVDADAQGRIKRLYWVQFEGYLPNNDHTYNYKVNKTATIGGLDFIADAYPRNLKANPGRADSDGSRARSFLESKNLQMISEDVLSQRLVYMVDKGKRNELMIIYLEDLSGMGLTAADLSPGGRAADRWEQVSKELLERATKGMTISQ
jgi:hypothetical protein